MGVVPLGQHPFRPFQIQKTSRITLDNDRTEVHAGQQDFIGGITVEEEDQALYVTATVDGAPAVDLLLVQQPQGDALFATYTSVAGPAVPSSAPFGAVVQAGQTLQQYIPVPRRAAGLSRAGRQSPVTGASPQTNPPRRLPADQALTTDTACFARRVSARTPPPTRE